MLSPERKEELASLQKKLGYQFKSLELLEKSLTHKSYSNESSTNPRHNERLEFLGDSVIDLIVGDFMIVKYEDHSEGVLSKIRAAVVNESCLAGMARKLDLGKYLRLGKGEGLSGGRNKDSILANTYEALAGAIYRDGGLQMASDVLSQDLTLEIVKYEGDREFRDHKSELQTYTQNKMSCIPEYRVDRELGPDHNKTFEMVVIIGGEPRGSGSGRSKKEAEQAAAKMALDYYQYTTSTSLQK